MQARVKEALLVCSGAGADTCPLLAGFLACLGGRALYFLRDKQFDKAIEVLKSFEKKDQHLKAMAATNLSFIYFLEHDHAQVPPTVTHADS